MTTPQPLWNDDAIVEQLRLRQSPVRMANGWHVIPLIAAAGICHMIRDEYEHELAAARARVAELEAQLEAERGEWEPVPQEEPFNSQGDYVMGTGQGLAVWLQCSVASAVWHGVPLGENIRLMRRVAGATGEHTP